MGVEGAMSRKLNHLFAGAAVLGCIAIGSTIAWSNIFAQSGGAYPTRVDFDHAFTDAGAMTRPADTPTNRMKLLEIGLKRLNAVAASQ
jgi:hypothetical protein